LPFEDIWNQGKLAVIDEIIDADHIDRGPSALPWLPAGREGTRMFVTIYRNAFPDLHFVIEEQIAEGDVVASRWTGTGTQKGELGGMPPSGRSVNISGVATDRFRDGKVVESWGIFDQFAMLQQLGAMQSGQ
jgi:steroid delta-isomerase-like uncharacterized protein